MNDLFIKAQLWAAQNKTTLIKVGSGALGAVIGALVAGLILGVDVDFEDSGDETLSLDDDLEVEDPDLDDERE